MASSIPDDSHFLDHLHDLMGDTRTTEQRGCSHFLSVKMHDGKYFCPSCKLVSSFPLGVR